MSKPKLKARKRKTFGKKAKKMRREGLLPGIIYGPKFESLPVKFELLEFQKLLKEAGRTNVIELIIDEKDSHPVLVKQVQVHPLSDIPLHIDFYRVDLTKKVVAKVPLELTGVSEVIKSGVGILLELINEVEVEALPSEIPSVFEVDISVLGNIGDVLTVGSLSIPEGVSLKVDADELVCKISEPSKQEEEKEVVAEGEESEDESEEEEKTEEEKEEGGKSSK